MIENFDNRFAVKERWYVQKKSDNSFLLNTTTTTQNGWSGTNDSVSHPWPYTSGGPWALTRTRNEPGRVSGTLDPYSSGYRAVYDRWSVTAAIANGSDAILSGSTTINDVLARSNPSRPSFDLPYFFSELRELPELIWHQGKNLAKSAANANLVSEYGWELLIPDLRAMLDFQNAVDRRVRHLANMFHRGGLRVEAELRKGSYRNSPVVTGLSSPCKDLTTVKYGGGREWCSVSWIPETDPALGYPPLSEIRRRAFSACIGNRVDLALAWNILPWSWLIDWFGHLGSFLSAKSNLVGFIPGPAYIMRHMVRGTDHFIRTIPSFDGSVEIPMFIRESKTRTPTLSSGFTASMPILTGRQVGILASLAVLKLL